MIRRAIRRPSPAMLVAVAAVVLALGGTATAASLISGSQIRNNTVTGADVRNSSLRGVDIRNGSLGASDLSSAARAALQGQQGPQGPPGQQGAQGAQGVQGPPGLSGVQTVSAGSGGFTSDSPQTATANCPDGKRVIGGGHRLINGTGGTAPNLLTDVAVHLSEPTEGQAGWVVTAIEEEAHASNWQLLAFAICANVSQ